MESPTSISYEDPCSEPTRKPFRQDVNDCEAISPSKTGALGRPVPTHLPACAAVPCRMKRAEAGEGTSLGTRSNGSHPAIPLTPDTWAVSRPAEIIYFKCIMCYIDFKRYKWDFCYLLRQTMIVPWPFVVLVVCIWSLK